MLSVMKVDSLFPIAFCLMREEVTISLFAYFIYVVYSITGFDDYHGRNKHTYSNEHSQFIIL